MRTTIKRLALLFVPVFVLCWAAVPSGTAREELRTDTPRNTLETARLFLKQGRYSKAVGYYDILLTRFKESTSEAAWGLYEKSYCLYKLKKYGLALRGFKSIRQVYPDEMGPVILADKMIAKIELENAKDIL